MRYASELAEQFRREMTVRHFFVWGIADLGVSFRLLTSSSAGWPQSAIPIRSLQAVRVFDFCVRREADCARLITWSR